MADWSRLSRILRRIREWLMRPVTDTNAYSFNPPSTLPSIKYLLLRNRGWYRNFMSCHMCSAVVGNESSAKDLKVRLRPLNRVEIWKQDAHLSLSLMRWAAKGATNKNEFCKISLRDVKVRRMEIRKLNSQQFSLIYFRIIFRAIAGRNREKVKEKSRNCLERNVAWDKPRSDVSVARKFLRRLLKVSESGRSRNFTIYTRMTRPGLVRDSSAHKVFVNWHLAVEILMFLWFTNLSFTCSSRWSFKLRVEQNKNKKRTCNSMILRLSSFAPLRLCVNGKLKFYELRLVLCLDCTLRLCDERR